MNKTQFDNYNNIPVEKFAFAKARDTKHDAKLDTKPIGYFRDAFNRFKKNKASLVAAIIIIILVIYALIAPFFVDQDFQNSYASTKELLRYKQLLPRLEIFDGTGFWDGTKVEEVTQNRLYELMGMEVEVGYPALQKQLGTFEVENIDGSLTTKYKVRVNTYYANNAFNMTFTSEQYAAIQEWQNKTGIQVILPRVQNPVNNPKNPPTRYVNLNIWYKCDARGNPVDAMGKPLRDNDPSKLVPSYFVTTATDVDDYNSIRLETDLLKDPGNWSYAFRTGAKGAYNYICRVSAYNYFQYLYEFEPSFIFGTDGNGYDIFSRLAKGAQFSFLLAIAVAAINLTIGAVYGAIEGYFGGVTDMVMERISDLLSGVPSMVVTILFQLHLASKVGVIGALLYAFVLTGWIGMASRVRMQFYRFKNQEYVLAARTLGAKDWRIIWKHIFPNTLGTIITSCVLVIPGVIFSETSLSYLGIINLDSATMSSVGSMLAAGQSVMNHSPHVIFFPALFIALLEICFNLFGNGLRDAFNPSLRGTED